MESGTATSSCARARAEHMAPAHDDVASGGRRRGRRNLSWGNLLCFGSQEAEEEGTTTPWERSRRRRKKRTVPVDGDLVGTTAANSEVMRRGAGTDEESRSRKHKGLRLPGCCFLAPARAPGHEHSATDSGGGGGRRNKQRHLESTEHPRSQSDMNSPSPSEASQIQATGGSNSNSNSNGSRSRGAEQRRSAPPAETTRTPTKPSKTGADGGVGAFGPVVGLFVVVAVSMAGLLGGRLWAVACVCAWLAALSKLRRREAVGGEVAVDVDSTDHEEPVVLERDWTKAVTA